MLSRACGGLNMKPKYTITTGKRPQPVAEKPVSATEPVKKERKKKNA